MHTLAFTERGCFCFGTYPIYATDVLVAMVVLKTPAFVCSLRAQVTRRWPGSGLAARDGGGVPLVISVADMTADRSWADTFQR